MRSGRAGGVRGQEEWEDRRAGLVQTPRRPAAIWNYFDRGLFSQWINAKVINEFKLQKI